MARRCAQTGFKCFLAACMSKAEKQAPLSFVTGSRSLMSSSMLSSSSDDASRPWQTAVPGLPGGRPGHALIPQICTSSSSCQCATCKTSPGLVGSIQQQLMWRRSMACSAGLGRAPPKVINIEFDPRDVEAFIEIADAIEAAFPKVIVNGNEAAEGRPGSFEVTTEDGVGLYSRMSSKRMPSPMDILNRISNRASFLTGDTDKENRPFCG